MQPAKKKRRLCSILTCELKHTHSKTLSLQHMCCSDHYHCNNMRCSDHYHCNTCVAAKHHHCNTCTLKPHKHSHTSNHVHIPNQLPLEARCAALHITGQQKMKTHWKVKNTKELNTKKKGEICICEYKLHTVDDQIEKKTALEAKYKTELAEHFGIVFNS